LLTDGSVVVSVIGRLRFTHQEKLQLTTALWNWGVWLGHRQNHTFSLGQYTTVFQTEVNAIRAQGNYRNRNIYIISDRETVIKALGNNWITIKLRLQMVKNSRVQLIWVPGYGGISDNKRADQLAKLGSEQLSIGPESARGISVGVSKKAKQRPRESLGFLQWTQTGKGTPTGALCQYNKRAAKIK
jgi:hypothetical protein